MSEQYGGRPGVGTAPTRPGPALGAAVLAFVEAGLLLALVVVTVAALAGRSPGGGVGVAAFVCLAACSLAALYLLGGLLLRGGGRTVLLVRAAVEAALAGPLLLVALVDVAVRRWPTSSGCWSCCPCSCSRSRACR